jgi:hypothetical protein
VSRSPQLLPSARFALWFTAWAAGAVSLDDARDALVGEDAAHSVHALPGEADLVPVIVALGRLRALGANAAGLALPVPGDPLGLAGPAGFNAEAIQAGEGVVLQGVDLGLVPRRTGAGVVWTCHEALSQRQVPDPSEADSCLRQALLRASNELAELDVARWRPDVADELTELRRTARVPFPAGMAPRAQRLLSLATKCRTIVGLALDDDGGALTAREAERRRAVLTTLDRAARRGLVAACSFPWQR